LRAQEKALLSDESRVMGIVRKQAMELRGSMFDATEDQRKRF
jgi:hypothetical protein